MEIINSWWAYQVRLLPVMLAFCIFSGFHLLRKLTKIEYTPSYFAVFPLTMIEGQLAEYFGEQTYGNYQSIKKGQRKRNNGLYVKAWVSIFLTFLLVPLITGFVAAFILTRAEFSGFLVLLVSSEILRCSKAVWDFANYRDNWNSVFLYFVPFYLTYVCSLGFVVRYGYHFTIPFTENADYAGLFNTLETNLVPIFIGVFVLGVVTNLLSHYLVNKDSLMPSWVESDETDDEEDTDD